jgi:hypothetical protein
MRPVDFAFSMESFKVALPKCLEIKIDTVEGEIRFVQTF